MEFLYNLPLPVLGAGALIGAVLLSIGGLALFHKFVDRDSLRESHDVTGFVYAVVGVIYAVVLAFVVIVVWEQYREAEHVCQEEACHIGNLQRLGLTFRDSIRNELESEEIDYVESVIHQEWPAMSHGHEDIATHQKMAAIWRSYRNFRPTEAERSYYDASLSELSAFNNARRLRIISMNATIPPIMWSLLLGGGLICILFTYLFATPKRYSQYMITGLLASIIALTLFLIIAMDRPFKGGVSVKPEAFEYLVIHNSTIR